MKKIILIVDDEEDNRITVKSVLESQKYSVFTACDGDDCLKQVKKIKPDLILMDIMMPGTPVKEVVKKLKNFKIAYLSVVRVSEAEREDLIGAKNIVGFIQKPFDVQDLIDSVKKLTNNKN